MRPAFLFTAIAAVATNGPPIAEVAFSLLGTTVLVFVMLRLGLVAVMALAFADLALQLFPITSDFSAWYAGASLFVLLSVAAIAAFAFHSALAGRLSTCSEKESLTTVLVTTQHESSRGRPHISKAPSPALMALIE